MSTQEPSENNHAEAIQPEDTILDHHNVSTNETLADVEQSPLGAPEAPTPLLHDQMNEKGVTHIMDNHHDPLASSTPAYAENVADPLNETSLARHSTNLHNENTNAALEAAVDAIVPIPIEPTKITATQEIPHTTAETMEAPPVADADGTVTDPTLVVAQPHAAEGASTVDPAASETAPQEDEGAIWEPAEFDVLSGRGASVNSHNGNKKFRALCFARKALFEAGNHAAKRRISTEIVTTCITEYKSRFLRKLQSKGPWFEMTREQAILKASQVIRDYKRPDRLAQRELVAAAGKKRSRPVSTPMDDIVVPPVPVEPILENPVGISDSDVLCGRGAFVNGHVGNKLLRTLALERKSRFDAGSYTEKRALAAEIVAFLSGLSPPGRFLRRPKSSVNDATKAVAVQANDDDPGWEEVGEDYAIHKACQVMRDIARVDRRERDERRRVKKLKKKGLLSVDTMPTVAAFSYPIEVSTVNPVEPQTAQAVEQAVAATQQAMDNALQASVQNNVPEKSEDLAMV